MVVVKASGLKGGVPMRRINGGAKVLRVCSFISERESMDNLDGNSALSSPGYVAELASVLSNVADRLHDVLRRLTSCSNGDDSSLSYALLTEEYALRARTHVLLHDAARHALDGVHLTQRDLLSVISEVTMRLESADSAATVWFIVSDLITFSFSIAPGKATTVNFLIDQLRVNSR